jgi:hypothetical protein
MGDTDVLGELGAERIFLWKDAEAWLRVAMTMTLLPTVPGRQAERHLSLPHF